MTLTPEPPSARPDGIGAHQADLQAMALLRGTIDVTEVADAARNQIVGFECWTPPAAGAGLLVSALAAVRPDAIVPALGEALGTVIARADVSRTWQPEVDEAFALLALLIPTPASEVVLQVAVAVLRTAELHHRWFDRATGLLTRLNDLDPNSVNPSTLLDVASLRSDDERAVLLQAVLTPLMLANPSNISVATLQRVVELQGEPRRARYLLAAIANHAAAAAEVRQFARETSAGWFPLRDSWRRALATSSPRILCVQNIADGQGDEIIRVVPLLQALLDGFPASRLTLVTDRGYLYRHARVETISFDETGRIGQALDRDHDILIEFADSGQPHLNHDPDLVGAIERYRASHRPVVDVGAPKGWNRFVFDRVMIGGFDWASALEVHRSLEANVYDPVLRLIAELGLPLRVGEQPPAGESVLAGGPSSSGDAAWDRASSANVERRPVALLNPFGGSAALKGFTSRKFDDLVSVIARLIAEGYFVLVCPNGQPWGSIDAVREVIDRLQPEARRHVGMVPEPPGAGNAATGRRDDGQPQTAGELVQWLIWFIDRANLVVTIEGWMMHAAYLAGRPYRLLTLPASDADSWQPWGRGADQRPRVFVGDPKLDTIPLPEQPRKNAWIELIRRIHDDVWMPYLEQIAITEDSDIRGAVVRTIGGIGGPQMNAWLSERLNDRSRIVRAAAATALLDHHRAAVGTDPIPGARVLEVHRLLGAAPVPWDRVAALGEAALPALDVALHGDDPVIRRESALCVEHIRRGIRQAPQPGLDRRESLGAERTPETSPRKTR